MRRHLLKSKLHRAAVTETNLSYEGSITIDNTLCERVDFVEFEQVDIYNCNNGARFTTYVIFGKKCEICLNGAASRLAEPGDRIIIASYADYEEEECWKHKPKLVLLDEKNEEVQK